MNPEFIRELFFHFTLSKEITTKIEYDEVELQKATIKKMYPFNEEDKIASDYAILPLITIGEIDGNANFCRVSANYSTPSILYIHFRPLNIEGVERLIKGKMIEMVSKYFRFKKLTLTQDYSLDNLIHLTRLIDGKKVSHGVIERYEEELRRPMCSIYLNNNFKTLSQQSYKSQKKYYPHVHRFLGEDKSILCDDVSIELNQMYLNKAIKKNVSMMDTLVKFIESYRPSQVYFSGYSLGSGMALASSYLIHRSLTIKPLFSVFQYAGPKVGTSEVADYIQRHFKECHYISVSKNGFLDLVSCIQKPPFQHIGHLWNIDLAQKTLQSIPNNGSYGTFKLSMTKLIIGFILKRPYAEPFQSVHNAAENLIGRILLERMVEQNISLKPYITDGPVCEYFSEGYSGKYEVCPSNECHMVSEVVQKKKVNRCLPNVESTPELNVTEIKPIITKPKVTGTKAKPKDTVKKTKSIEATPKMTEERETKAKQPITPVLKPRIVLPPLIRELNK